MNNIHALFKSLGLYIYIWNIEDQGCGFDDGIYKDTLGN